MQGCSNSEEHQADELADPGAAYGLSVFDAGLIIEMARGGGVHEVAEDSPEWLVLLAYEALQRPHCTE
ncbi:hypothetical protein J2W21_003022 [Sinomonas atrocyanea]|uniref:hypothetical protein n=1 Tax=Sinomonas atrocyanea TaxID=37927 RepID=UPI002782AAB2|nr:hypothetical protein [Sinomonas atrocyanea]MDP9885499.1 hypothetical protein [Sinomonas atrocyanea]